MGLLAMYIVDTTLDVIAAYKPIRYLLRSFIARLFFHIVRAIIFGAVFFVSTVSVWCVVDLAIYIHLSKQRLVKTYLDLFSDLFRTSMDSFKAEIAKIPHSLSNPVVMLSLYTISVIAFAFLAVFWLRLVHCLSLKGRIICTLRLGSFVAGTLLIAMMATYWMGPMIVHQELDSSTYQLLAQIHNFYWVFNPLSIISLLPEEMESQNLFGPTETYTQENIDTSNYPLYRKTLTFKGEKTFDIPGFQSGKKHNVVIHCLEAFKAADVGVLDPMKKFTKSLSPTPNIDSLSKQGILYSNFFLNGVQTSRTIPSILFGSLPKLDTTAITNHVYMNMAGLPQDLKAMGYHTRFQSAVDTEWDNWNQFLLTHGFDEVLDLGYHQQRLNELNVTEKPELSWGLHDETALKVLPEDVITMRRSNITFFNMFVTVSSHHPFSNPDSYVVPDFSDAVFVNEDDRQKVISASYVDAQIGTFMNKMSAEGALNDTIVIIMGDHGYPIGEHGTNFNEEDPLHNELVDVPLLLIAPGMDSKYHGTIVERERLAMWI